MLIGSRFNKLDIIKTNEKKVWIEPQTKDFIQKTLVWGIISLDSKEKTMDYSKDDQS
jgi:hypothetical protein